MKTKDNKFYRVGSGQQYVRFGSVAALQHDISPTAASGGKAVVRRLISWRL